MLLFLISCFSFLLLSSMESRIWAFPQFLFSIFVPFFSKGMLFTPCFEIPRIFPYVRKNLRPRTEILEEKKDFSLLDLPDLALDSILEKLNPPELCVMAGVCYFLREKCTSDHFWGKHFEQKWGGVVGDSFFREWECYVASKRVPRFLNSRVQKGGFLHFFSGIFFKIMRTKETEYCVSRCFLPVNSVMSCYLALETGKFWFPAQVFNREVQNGRIGFVLSCYDAKLSYDSISDNFVARYPSFGKSMIEEGIEWDRIRAPSLDTPANAAHVSTCLDKLKPGDHVEIQWRRNQEFPYGWWYGVVGHIESCINESHCQCHINDVVILEFKQYSAESRWRRVSILRKDQIETGDEAVGFYGGIRKVCKKEEIEKWRHLWPDCTLE